MEEPLVISICCITYNHEPYIRQCLEGFMMQKTNFPFEVLIHDDASTDGTADIIRRYESKYPDIIKPIYQKENQYSKGVEISSTFNYPRAKGKYMAVCEGDDYWIDPLKLQKQVDFLENNPEYSMCFHDAFIYDPRKQTARLFCNHQLIVNKLHHIINTEDLLSNDWMIPTASMVFRSAFVKKKAPEFLIKALSGDYALHLMFSIDGGNIYYMDMISSVYRSWDSIIRVSTSPQFFLKKMVELLDGFEEYSNHKYSKEIKKLKKKYINNNVFLFRIFNSIMRRFTLFFKGI
jgi:glycosyltransferase involved in cell wall biosynthesis